MLFPGIPFHCAVAHPEDIHMIRQIIRGRRWLAALPVHGPQDPGYNPEERACMVCLARIRRVQWMPDGGLLMDLLGVARATVQAILPQGSCYHSVQIEVLRPNGKTQSFPEGWLRQAQRDISALRGQPYHDQDPYPLAMWVDLLCHFLPVPFTTKLKLLCEPCDHRRCEMLANYGRYWRTDRLMRQYLPKLFRSN